MSRIHCFCLTAVLISANPLAAELQQVSVGGTNAYYLHDTNTGYDWFPYLGNFSGMTYQEKLSAIAQLDFGPHGPGDWHMADFTEFVTIWNPVDPISVSLAKIDQFQPSTFTIAGSTPEIWDPLGSRPTYIWRYDAQFTNTQGLSTYVTTYVQHKMYTTWDFWLDTYVYDYDHWPVHYQLASYDPELYNGPGVGAWVIATGSPEEAGSLTVIPLPGALLMAGTGLSSAALGLKRLRRKHQE